MRLVYVDDSGAEISGIVAYSWVELVDGDWSIALGRWLDWRDLLWERHQIGKAVEIHSTSFVNGRGRPSLNDEWNASKARRRAVFVQGLDAIAGAGCLRVGTVYARTTGRRGDYRAERLRVYGELVSVLDGHLAGAGELGIVVMDGDGTDTGYLGAHRALRLRTRRIVEDPMFQHSSRSQWLQMADMVAYSAYQEILQEPAKAFAHGWYSRLREIDVLGGPLAV
ncbi:DUF3800 domain-containing protein [Arsenicicoccus dermatophilus]|uniref:DUF3800 domain-containing protein n=1 Tax=Arsenicicoccus dermatophilus TaxID=1076331 RepID=UPI0039172292